MKKLFFFPFAVFCLTGSLQGQSSPDLSVSNQLTIAGYTVTGLGPDTRTWSGSIVRSNEVGGLTLASNRVVELGLYNRWDPQRSQWVESQPELVVTNQGVIGRGARHEVFFAANLNTLGAIWVRLPATATTPAQYLKTHVMALAYACGGTNYVLGQVKDSTAEVLNNNRVLYRDAFEELKADILYSYSAAGLMQFVVLREQPPTPESLGLSGDSVKLVAITEIVEGPEPSVTVTNTVDPQIGFGPMSMTHGRAFLLKDQDQPGLWQGPHVLKRYEVIRDRRFLFEGVDLSRIQDQLSTLPVAGTVTNASVRKPMRFFAAGTLPAAPPQANGSAAAVRQASLSADHAGFALDWDLVHTHSADFTFESAAQVTYVLRHQAHLSGRTVFEPGAVVLVQEGPLHIDGPLGFGASQTGGSSNKVIFSTLNDPTVAGVLGQQDLPQEPAYGPALAVLPDDYRAVIRHIEIRYAGPAVVLNAPSALPTVQVAVEDPQGSETPADQVVFRINRRDGDYSQPLTVRYRAKVGAVAGADAEGLVSSSANIPANQDSVQVRLPVSQDAAFAGPVAVRLQPDELGSYLLGEAAVSSVGQGIQPMTATPAPAGMVAWWKAESNGSDSSGNGHNASTLNAVGYVGGKVNQAFSFNGTSSYAEVPNISGLNNNLTIEFWVKRQRVDSHAEFIVEQGGDFTWGQQNFGVSFHPTDNKLCFTWANGYRLSGGSISDTTTWHHCAVVAHQGDANPTFYIDGAAQSVDAGGGTINLHSTSLPLHIGAQRDTYYNYYSQTLIDELTIYNACLTAGDIWAIYTAGADGKVLCDSPSITSQPQNQTVNQGGNASFSASATGAAPLSFQWYKGDDAHPIGNNSSILSLQNVQPSDSGIYYVKVTNCGGAIRSANASLTVAPAPPPCATLPSGAIGWWKAEGNVTEQVNGIYNGWLTGGAGYASGESGVCFSFDGASGYATVANVPDLTSQFTIEFWLKRQRLVGAYEYLVEKGGDWSYGQQNFALQLHGPDNDLVFTWAGGYRGAWSIADYDWHHCAVTATSGQPNPVIYVDGVARTIALSGGSSTMSFPNFNRPLHIGAQIDPNSGWNYYSGTLIDELTIYNRVLSPTEINDIYNAGAVGKCLPPSPVAPTITTQPQSQTVCPGSTASFSLVASGTAPLSYQWYRNDDFHPVGGNSSALSLVNVQSSDGGAYYAKVSNAGGVATTQSAALTVAYQPPTITTQPQSQTVVGGGGASFSVVASGCAALTYQWFHNGVMLQGATAATENLSGVHLADAGDYEVVVSNPGGSAVSAAATLAVSEVAAPIFNPVGGSYTSAKNVTVTCATPGAVIHYTLNGTAPTEADPIITSGATLLINNNPTALQAKAWKSGSTPSELESQTYRIEASPSDMAPAISISPPSGSSILASDDIPLLVTASDADGSVTRIQLFRDGVKIAEATQNSLQYTFGRVFSGTYTFTARAIDNVGFVSVSSPAVFTVVASAPAVALQGQKPLFTSSPGTLLASVLGVNPGSLTSLTLNGIGQAVATGTFSLSPALAEGDNTFTLAAVDTQSRNGQATTKITLDSVAPAIIITSPANNSSFATTRTDISGSFTESAIQGISVNGVPAFINGSSWTAVNVPLGQGANTITATAQDIAGNSSQATITINAAANPIDPVQLSATPIGGFAPLQVSFQSQGNTLPGTIQQVQYDFDGDGVVDQTTGSLGQLLHTYNSAGEFFPVVSVVTTVGRFSSIGGWNGGNQRLRINVQASSDLVRSINVVDPVDVKCTPEGNIYVLSRSTATITEFNSSGATLRSLSGIGSTPNGLDVDAGGNVYVAMSGDHQVRKFDPTSDSFIADVLFNGGRIGRTDKTPGAGDAELNAPFDVALSPDGHELAISDSGNHRVQRFNSMYGTFIGSFGAQGHGPGQLSSPKGVAYDAVSYLYIVDSGNVRVVLSSSSDYEGASGALGPGVGQFQAPVNIATGPRGIYVADTGNNGIEFFEPIQFGHGKLPVPFVARGVLGAKLGLNQPKAVAVLSDCVQEKVCIADTGNARILIVALPSDAPDAVWSSMRQQLVAGNIPGAISCFAKNSSETYRQKLLLIGSTSIASMASQMPSGLIPIYIESATAQYRFEQTLGGRVLSFPVDFVKENGLWKIAEF